MMPSKSCIIIYCVFKFIIHRSFCYFSLGDVYFLAFKFECSLLYGEVKLLFLTVESGGFEESSVTAVSG